MSRKHKRGDVGCGGQFYLGLFAPSEQPDVGRDLEKIMSAITQYNAFSEALFHRMELDGFKQRSKSTTQKKQRKYFSQLVLYTNKLRGMDRLRRINFGQ